MPTLLIAHLITITACVCVCVCVCVCCSGHEPAETGGAVHREGGAEQSDGGDEADGRGGEKTVRQQTSRTHTLLVSTLLP